MKKLRHFIWDFDGTLFDTYPRIIENLRLTLQEFGFDCDPVEAMGWLLINVPVTLEHYAQHFGIELQSFAEAYRQRYLQQGDELQAAPFAGIEAVLAKICETGRYNYIFTNRNAEQTEQYLKRFGFDRYFREIVGVGSEGFAYKPAPDALLYLMEKYTMQPQEAVMVGDRDCDLESARNANMPCAHYVCAMSPQTLPCTWRIESYEQMLQLL